MTLKTIPYEELESNYKGFVSDSFHKEKLLTFWLPDEKYSYLKDIDPFLQNKKKNDDLIPLALGMPNSGFFPIESIDLNLTSKPFHYDNLVKTTIDNKQPSELPLSQVLQYGETNGLQPVLDFAKDYVTRLGNAPQYSNWDVCVGSGSSESLYKIFEIFANENTSFLVEELTFVPALSIVVSKGANLIPMKMNIPVVNKNNYNNDQVSTTDEQGIDVEYLTNLLENWESGKYKDKPRPKFLYTVTTGQNPSGVATCFDKKKKIYQLAQKYDFIIVEDDPYGYLRYPTFNKSNPTENLYKDDSLTLQKYIDDLLIKSYLSLDTDGRVLRAETFSKIFAPGLRLSFVCGNQYLINQLIKHNDLDTRGASSVSQAVVYSAVKKLAEVGNCSMSDAWINWFKNVAEEYTDRRNAMLHAIYSSEAFKKGYLEVVEPAAGMFVVIKINFQSLNKPNLDIIEEMNRVEQYFAMNGLNASLIYKMAIDKELSHEHYGLIRTAISFTNDTARLAEAIDRINTSLIEIFEKRFQ